MVHKSIFTCTRTIRHYLLVGRVARVHCSWTWVVAVRRSYVHIGMVCITIYKTQTIAFHLHPSSNSHGYYYILCDFCFGRGRKRATKNTTRIKEVVRKFAFYPASGRSGEQANRRTGEQRFTPCTANYTVRMQEPKPTDGTREKIQLVPFRAQSVLRCRTIETRNIISSLGKLLPHQWRKPYAKLSKLSLSFVYRLSFARTQNSFYFSVPNIWVSFQFSAIASRAFTYELDVGVLLRTPRRRGRRMCAEHTPTQNLQSHWINLIFLCCSF